MLTEDAKDAMKQWMRAFEAQTARQRHNAIIADLWHATCRCGRVVTGESTSIKDIEGILVKRGWKNGLCPMED